jgi:hypothetical protein
MTKRLNLKRTQIKEMEVKRLDEKINILNEKICSIKKQIKQLKNYSVVE